MTQATPFTIRLPDGMRSEISRNAKAANRSMQSEVVYRLYTDGSHGIPDGSVYHSLGSRAAERFMVRIPSDLHDNIKLCAAAQGRSMNSEIVIRLAVSLYGGANIATPLPIPAPKPLDICELRALRKKVAATLSEIDAIIERVG